MKKTVWLLNPPTDVSFFKEGRCQQQTEFYITNYPPLTLAYLASILREKYHVRLLTDKTAKEIAVLYNKQKPDQIYVNTTTPTIDSDLKFLKRFVDSKIYLFGIHPSFFKKKYEKENISVIDDPLKFAYYQIHKKNPKNLDSYPFPAWDLVNLNRYRLPLKGKRFVLVQASTGCPYDCYFCTKTENKVHMRTVNSLISELKYIKNLGIYDVIFFADTFTINRKWLRELCNKLMKENLNMSFSCNSRVDTIDKKTLIKMKNAGFWLISFGIESGSQMILDNVNKGINIKQIKEATKLAYIANIMTLGHFIIGLPGEDKNTILNTINFSNKLLLDFAMFYIATPFPGSQLYKNQSKKWSNYDYSKNIINPSINLEKYQKKAYLKFYTSNIFRRIRRMIRILGFKTIPQIFLSSYRFIRVYRK